MTRPSISDEQAHIYLERAADYDRLVSAEDADGHLQKALCEALPRGTVADIGAGTGRIARMLADHATRFVLVERAAPMLEIARECLRAMDLEFVSHLADARELPLASGSVDAAVAGWVFGHFRHWMPDGWRAEVDQAVDELERIVRPGGPVVVVETLGTGHEEPRKNDALDEYFAHLEGRGFERSWVRTDYAFSSADEAAAVLGEFFGDEMAADIRAKGTRRVPECTGLWRRTI
ncbi:MAG: class I SAM-dependent methyltransferase [Myxococcales bacterium]|nr:class I SAM-dependent methyltransferase [Myxococcales bacterium]